MGWTRANKLKFHPDKVEVLLVGRDYTPMLDGVALTPEAHGHVGVLLDLGLLLDAQVVVIMAWSAYYQLRLVLQL